MKKFSRVVVIAPTRSTCVNINVVLTNGEIPPTLLMQEKGEELADAVIHLEDGGFGVVAGTGTGKTVAIRDIAANVLKATMKVDTVTREHEATPYTWTCNVLVVTPGVALNWLKAQRITSEDLIVIDEIHQTSEHLELAMAIAKRAGCTFVWMSATIDPKSYASYLDARAVIHCHAVDPERKAFVECVEPFDDSFSQRIPPLVPDSLLKGLLPRIIGERRGVACFVPTRAMAESLAKQFAGDGGLHSEFYHGGETADKLLPYLKGEVPKPFIVFMTVAGASSLNIAGLDTVVITDECHDEVVRSGVKSLEKMVLGNNELLQMGGRVNGRAVGGEIYILTRRTIDFHGLTPVTPEFKLGGDLKRVALTCAKLRVDARDLDLIGHIDMALYASEVERFRKRGLIYENGELKLTPYGVSVERLPVEPHWGEVLVNVEQTGDIELMDVAITVACIQSLYSLVRSDRWDGFGITVRGSDHLTSYNIIAKALRQFGWIKKTSEGQEYKLRGDWYNRRHGQEELGEFRKWCEERKLNPKAIKEVLLAMKSVYTVMGHKLLEPEEFSLVTEHSLLTHRFVELLARTQSLVYVHLCRNSNYTQEIGAPKVSVARSAHKLGTVRAWTDDRGWLRANVEGTAIPEDMIVRFATKHVTGVDSYDGEVYQVTVSEEFAGEELESSSEFRKPDNIPQPWQAKLPSLLAQWVVMRMM